MLCSRLYRCATFVVGSKVQITGGVRHGDDGLFQLDVQNCSRIYTNRIAAGRQLESSVTRVRPMTDDLRGHLIEFAVDSPDITSNLVVSAAPWRPIKLQEAFRSSQFVVLTRNCDKNRTPRLPEL